MNFRFSLIWEMARNQLFIFVLTQISIAFFVTGWIICFFFPWSVWKSHVSMKKRNFLCENQWHIWFCCMFQPYLPLICASNIWTNFMLANNPFLHKYYSIFGKEITLFWMQTLEIMPFIETEFDLQLKFIVV